MKKILKILLFTTLGIASLAGAGVAGFKMGIRQATAIESGDEKSFGGFHRFGNDGDPQQGFHHFGGPGFNHPGQGFGPGRTHGGRGFISPFFILAKLALLGLLAWLGYKLFKGNGWQLTLARVQPAATQTSPEPDPTEEKPRRRGKQ